MERNREARRAMNGGGAASGMLRRRQRNGSFRDSPEEDGGMEMQAMGRLRDRGIKKDRDRDRSGRSKRRRGDRDRDRTVHASNREEGEDTSEDSEDEEDEEIDEEASIAPRITPPPAPLIISGPPASLSQNHHRKSFPMTAKATRPPVMWNPADEMIGVSVPRKARSSSVKRTQEFSVAGGEPVHRQASTSPARPSTSSAMQISPTSSASAKKKMKVMTGSKHRPPKVSKSPVSEDIEIEVAEVLYGLTRQFQSSPPKSESKEANGSSNEMKPSRISSPISSSLQPGASQSPVLAPLKLNSNSMPISAMAPKRKKPRHIKPEDDRSANPPNVPSLSSISASSATKIEPEKPAKPESSPEKNTVSLTTVAGSNGQSGYGVSQAVAVTVSDVPAELMKMEIGVAPDLKISGSGPDCQDQTEIEKEAPLPAKEILPLSLDVNMDEPSVKKDDRANDGSQKAKLSIDLMVTPLGKSSPERESLSNYVSGDQKAEDIAIQLASKEELENREVKPEESTKPEAEETVSQFRKVENSMPKVLDAKKEIAEELLDSKKQIAEGRTLDLQLDFEKQEKDGLGCTEQQVGKQPPGGAKMELGTAKCEQSASLPLPISVAGWPGRPGTLPQFGYMGQVPCLPAVPADGGARSSSMQRPTFPSSQARPKRCATHCYIAHNIHYHQQLSRMNPFWPVTAGTAPLYGSKHYDLDAAKHYNLNAAPPSDSILGSSLQPNIASRNKGPSEEKAGQLPAAHLAHLTKEKPSSSNIFTEAAPRKQPVVQQAPQPDYAANMLQGPAFIFPINQQQAAAAAAAARSAASKAAPGATNAVTSSTSASSVVGSSGASGQPATMSFNYPVLSPNEAQYMAILQNSGYPFPIPAHVGAPPAYKGGCAPQSVPFFNGPFYSSQMLHPQMQQQQQVASHQQPSNSHAQQGHQNTSTSSGSSSSQKPPRHSQLTSRGGSSGNVGTSQAFPASKEHRQHLPPQFETGNEDNPSTADSRASQAQKNIYGHNFAMAIHPQNFALLSPAAAAAALGSGATAAAALGGGSGNRNEKQQPPPHNQPPKADLTTSQAFALSLASFTGASGALPQGLGFSSMAQNHAIFQSLPEASKQGYHINAATQASQYRKSHQQIADDGKPKRDSINACTGEEERKMKATSKTMGSVPQHSINFSQSENDRPSSIILGNTVVDSSSKTLNLIQSPVNGSRLSNRPASAAPATSSPVSAPAPANSQLQQQQQQHQHLIQLQKQQQQQQQQQLQLQQQQLQQQFVHRSTKSSTTTNSTPMYSDRLPASSNLSKFNQTLAGFPQAFIQGNGTAQSSQWKTSTRASTPAPAASSTSSPKNQLPQQQGRTLQQPILMPTHQTQISFGMNSSKAAVPAGQQHLPGGGSNPAFNSTSSAAVGSPQGCVSKSIDGSSPRAGSGAKQSASQANLVPIQQQQQQQQQSAKNSPTSNSTLKSSPLSNSNTSSILGHPPATQSASAKQQQQPQQLQKQPFPQPQFFFSSAYPQAQASQSNGSPAAGYYQQRRPSDQQSQHPSQQATASLPTGMFSLCPSSMTLTGVTMAATDPVKAAAAANSMKSMAVPGMLQHPAQFATVTQPASHPFMSAAAAFPYIHTMPAVSVKPAEQKPAAGNDSLHASWQPEKR